MPISTKKPLLIVITGPTASGKTGLGIKLAKHYNTEVISADSRQVFKGMAIGTAQPTAAELAQAKHHFIATLNPNEEFSAGIFASEAETLLNQLFTKHQTVICVGGSGLYVNALCKGLDNIPSIPIQIREQLSTEHSTKGIEHLSSELQEKDPEYANEVDLSNPHRVIRALEVIRHTGKTFTYFRKAATNDKPFNTVQVVLNWDREKLYDRINQRVDQMFDAGLLNEVKSLEPFYNCNSLNTVGYKEIIAYQNGDFTLEKAKEEIKKNTRRFAKRQLTWFRRETNINWINPAEAFEVVNKLCE